MPASGADFTESVGTYQDINEIKNSYRLATIPASIQPGMLFSRSTDDRLTHRVSAGQDYLIFQGDIVCANNEVVCANNGVVITLPV